jgi:hypothetical protein
MNLLLNDARRTDAIARAPWQARNPSTKALLIIDGRNLKRFTRASPKTTFLSRYGYDADRIRERLALDGTEPVIPSLPTCSQNLPLDNERYRVIAKNS